MHLSGIITPKHGRKLAKLLNTNYMECDVENPMQIKFVIEEILKIFENKIRNSNFIEPKSLITTLVSRPNSFLMAREIVQEPSISQKMASISIENIKINAKLKCVLFGNDEDCINKLSAALNSQMMETSKVLDIICATGLRIF